MGPISKFLDLGETYINSLTQNSDDPKFRQGEGL